MIEGKKILGLIPARGGSKGIKNKNLVNLNSKPLIEWTIIEAKQSRYIDKLFVSTDDKKIAEVSKELGVEIPFLRPSTLAQDDSTSVELMLYIIDRFPKYDLFVLLQPTSPLRRSGDIDAALELFIKKNTSTCISVTIVDKHPHWMFYLCESNRGLRPVIDQENKPTNRQTLPSVVTPNGAIYIVDKSTFKKQKTFISDETIAYVMSKKSSIDIDDEIDLQYCEIMVKMQ